MAHVHGGSATGRYLGLSILLTTLFVIGEAGAGFWSNSLALMSDAGHNFADVLALILSWYGLRASRRPADARQTFGYHRVGVFAALANALSLVVVAGFIFWEAAQRLRSPEPVEANLMIGVAVAAIVLNGLISRWLYADAKNDLNVRSAYLHMLGDALSAVGVVVAGIIVMVTGSTLADPLVSLIIGALILWSSWGILKESVLVLMDAAPANLNMPELIESIRSAPGVLDVHDLHVWTPASSAVACSFHLLVAEQSARDGQRIQQAVAEMLSRRFQITHSTIQIEVESCGVNGLHCEIRSAHAAPADGHAGCGHQH
jgi:cobalt-zinc-cadmium efflux system protein